MFFIFSIFYTFHVKTGLSQDLGMIMLHTKEFYLSEHVYRYNTLERCHNYGILLQYTTHLGRKITV